MADALLIAGLILAVTYILIVTETIDRTIAALTGAFLMIFYGIVSGSEIYSAIDFNVLAVIMGIMILVEVSKETSLFEFIAIKIVQFTKNDKRKMFIFIMLTTTLLASVLIDATAMLIISSITVLLARKMDFNPIPFVIGEALLCNTVGILTFISSTPNVIIGTYAGLSFNDFLMVSMPLGLILAGVVISMLLIFFRKDLKGTVSAGFELNAWAVVKDKKSFYRSAGVFALVLLGFVLSDQLSLGPDIIAMGGATLALLTTGVRVPDVLQKVDWSSIFFFSGLFIVISGIESAGLIELTAEVISGIVGSNFVSAILLVFWSGAGMSAIIDSGPLAVAFLPVIKDMVLVPGFNSLALWFAAIVALDIGGGLVPVGDPTGIVALGIAKKEGYDIFRQYLIYGFLVSLTSLAISCAYFILRFAIL